MPKKKESFSAEKIAEQKREAEKAERRRRKKNTIITVASILAVIAIVIGVGYYFIYAMPMQRTIISVNGEKISIDYLVKRCLMSDDPEDINSVRYQLAYELLIKQGSPEYGITITEADIDQAIRDAAKGTSEDISDAEVQEWFRQQLNSSQLSKAEFREYIMVSLMAQQLQELLEALVPTVGEQVHLHYILIEDYVTAEQIKARLDEGEDFATIASEVSIDTESAEDGGDKGWVPIDVLDFSVKYVVEDLDIGEISMLVPVGSGESTDTSVDAFAPYAIFMISEKAVSMEIAEEYMEVLRMSALKNWLSERSDQIKFLGQGSSGGYDSYTEAWILMQIRKLERSRGISAES